MCFSNGKIAVPCKHVPILLGSPSLGTSSLDPGLKTGSGMDGEVGMSLVEATIGFSLGQ